MAQKKQKRKNVGVSVYLPPELLKALDDLIEESRPRTNRTAVIEAALEDWIERWKSRRPDASRP